jgi:hypothetical protein
MSEQGWRQAGEINKAESKYGKNVHSLTMLNCKKKNLQQAPACEEQGGWQQPT